MKRLLGLILVASILVIAGQSPVPASAMGPIMVSAHIAKWDREANAAVTGYYVYWRSQGATSWSNTQRSAMIAQPATGQVPSFDLLGFNLPAGNYEITATATVASGNESGPSNIVPFPVDLPAAPTNLSLQ